MPKFDLKFRGDRLVTMGTQGFSDIGIRKGPVVATADRLNDAYDAVVATGLLILPGGCVLKAGPSSAFGLSPA